MNTDDRQGELQHLKQEVAELWTRFKNEETPLTSVEDAHRQLTLRFRELEEQRRKLIDRRAVLRHDLEILELRRSRVAPALRFLGGIAGVVISLAALVPLLDLVATSTVPLEPAHGAALLTLSLALLAVAVAGD